MGNFWILIVIYNNDGYCWQLSFGRMTKCNRNFADKENISSNTKNRHFLGSLFGHYILSILLQELLEEDEEVSFDALYSKTAAKNTDDNLDISDRNKATSVESIAEAKTPTLSISTQSADSHIDQANQPLYNSIGKSVAAKRRRTRWVKGMGMTCYHVEIYFLALF